MAFNSPFIQTSFFVSVLTRNVKTRLELKRRHTERRIQNRTVCECSTTQRSFPPTGNSNLRFGYAPSKSINKTGCSSALQSCLHQPILQRRVEGENSTKMVSLVNVCRFFFFKITLLAFFLKVT